MGKLTVIALIAIALLLVLGMSFWRSGGLETLLVRLFGPPQVELAETYAGARGGEVFDHSGYDELVAEHVNADGFVDYAGLAGHAAKLDAYIDSLATVTLDNLGRDEHLALLINAYNAFTLRLILDHLPVQSIRDIPAKERWDGERWVLAGETYSLNQIEHELVRPNFREPRIHFALVCASIGCPPLRSEAYTGDRLEQQLEDQTRFTHGNERWLRYERGNATIELTALYQWYAGDFEQVAGSVLEYAARYDDDLATDLAAGHSPAIRYLNYDWSLNAKR
jgi:hypothetical protein